MFQHVNPSTLKLWKIIKDEPKHRCFINHLSEDGKMSNWTSAETGLTGSSFLPWPLATRQNHPSRQLRILLLAAAGLWLGSISASCFLNYPTMDTQETKSSGWQPRLPPPSLHLPDTFLADLLFLTPHLPLASDKTTGYLFFRNMKSPWQSARWATGQVYSCPWSCAQRANPVLGRGCSRRGTDTCDIIFQGKVPQVLKNSTWVTSGTQPGSILRKWLTTWC